MNKNIKNLKKITNIIENLNDIDTKLERKNRRNQKDIIFYNELLNESKNNFMNIIKNIQ